MVFREGKALRLVAGGVEAEELGGVIEGGGFGGAAGFCPCLAADFAEFWGGFGEAYVAREEVGFREGDVEGHGVREFHGEDFAGTVGGLEFNVTPEEADPVLEVNERVAIREFREVQHLIDLGKRGSGALAPRRCCLCGLTEEFVIGKEDAAVGFVGAGEREPRFALVADDEAAREGSVEDFDAEGGGARVVLEGVAEALGAGFAGADGEEGEFFLGGPLMELFLEAEQIGGGIGAREVERFGGIETIMGGGFEGEGAAGGVLKEGGVGIDFADGDAGVLSGGARPEGLGDAADLPGGGGRGVEAVGVFAGEEGGFFEDPCEGGAGEVIEEGGVLLVFGGIGTGGGGDGEGFGGAGGALGGGIKGADALEFIAEEIKAVGLEGVERVEIEEAPANRELSRVFTEGF